MAFAGHSAGGCRNNLAMFATNPQYLLTVFDDDVGGGGSESSSSSDEDGGGRRGAAAGEKVRKTMVIISLGQEHRRTQRDRKVKLLQVNRNLYRVTPGAPE